ncbi:MAG: ArsB/NhaD family transporter [Myxococcales bacterium]|nr:ArsB/NhaD family transporter [Myxococcales bacterium]
MGTDIIEKTSAPALGEAAHASHVLFGMSSFWVAVVLFVAVYVAIMTEKLNRAVLALVGGGLLVLTGVLNQEEAVKAVDFNTLGLLLGMMLIVNTTQRSGLFQFVAIWSAKKVKANPWGVLLMMSVVTAVFSALLDNVTTVLLTVPVTLLITEELRVKPYPYLFTQIIASNIGGTATLIGDPPNIMIGSATGLTFNDFLLHVGPVALIVLPLTMVPLYFVWGRHLTADAAHKKRVMSFEERESITDPALLKKSLLVIALVITGFVLQRQIHIEPATTAMFGAALLLLLDNLGKDAETQSKNVAGALSEAEWITLMFFLGLFVLVHGLVKTGAIDGLSRQLLLATHGEFKTTTLAVLWASAVLSAFVDNIPFVASMIPMIKATAPTFGGDAALQPLWWALSLGACLGGNGTLIGASANLVVAGLAERAGVRFRFIEYIKVAFPLMLGSIVVSHVYMWLRYL